MADANKTTIFTTEKALARLRESVHAKATNFYAITPGIEVGVVLSNLAYPNCLDFRSEREWQSKSGEATIKSRQQYPTALKIV